MTPKDAVARLIDSGMSQAEIARRLTEAGISTTQPTIQRIGSGEIEHPRFELGAALIELCNKLPRARRTGGRRGR